MTQCMDLLKIFISYSSKNQKAVRRLAEDLAVLGHDVWFDEKLTGGRPWWEDILKRVRDSELFVFVVTPEALNSVACMREFDYACALKKRILPVIMGAVNIKTTNAALQAIQHVSYRQRSIDSYQKLIQALRHLPEPQPLPNPLPEEPATPISPLITIKEMIDDSGTLSREQQTSIITELNKLIAQRENLFSVRLILRKLIGRADVLATTEHVVVEMLTPICLPLNGHSEAVQVAAYNPEGTRIVTGGRDGMVRVWDAWTGREILALKAAGQVVYDANYSADGRNIVAASVDGVVRLWSADSGRRWREFKAHTGAALSASFHPHGRTVVTAGADNLVRVWSISSGVEQFQLQGHTKPVHCARFSPDGSKIVSAGGDGVRVWDAQAHRELRQLVGHTRAVHSAMFSADGSRILTASDDSTARVWDAETGREIFQMNANGSRVYCAGFNHNGKMIVTAHSDHKARLWDAKDGLQVMTLEGHTNEVYRAAYSPVLDMIVTASADRSARVWDVSDLAWGTKSSG